jgi:hypothetical protein
MYFPEVIELFDLDEEEGAPQDKEMRKKGEEALALSLPLFFLGK